jgi:hypothetical protein
MDRFGIARSLTSALIATAFFALSTPVLGQDAITAPAQKQIGATSAKIEPALIVLNARSATLDADKLTLGGVSANAIMFADRPVRAAGHVLTTFLLNEWSAGGSFGKDPPNATVSALSRDGLSVQDAVVVLKRPRLEGDRLTFDVDILEGGLNGSDGPATVFVDTLGLPFTSSVFPGMGAANRGAWYAGYAAASSPYEPGGQFGDLGHAMPWQ